MEINVDMIPQIELSTRHYNEQNINNTYYATYAVDNFIRTISFISKSKQTEIAEKYITHYKNTYTQKYVLVREIQKTKSIPPLTVRFRTLQTPTDIDPDIYKTIKTMSIPAHFEPPVRTLRATIPFKGSQYSGAGKPPFRT